MPHSFRGCFLGVLGEADGCSLQVIELEKQVVVFGEQVAVLLVLHFH